MNTTQLDGNWIEVARGGGNPAPMVRVSSIGEFKLNMAARGVVGTTRVKVLLNLDKKQIALVAEPEDNKAAHKITTTGQASQGTYIRCLSLWKKLGGIKTEYVGSYVAEIVGLNTLVITLGQFAPTE